jgi:N-acyl homoserine lactone hydrolase
MAASHSHPDHAGNIEMFPNTLMLVQKVEYEWAGSRQHTVGFNKKHPVKLVNGDYDIFGDGNDAGLYYSAIRRMSILTALST